MWVNHKFMVKTSIFGAAYTTSLLRLGTKHWNDFFYTFTADNTTLEKEIKSVILNRQKKIPLKLMRNIIHGIKSFAAR